MSPVSRKGKRSTRTPNDLLLRNTFKVTYFEQRDIKMGVIRIGQPLVISGFAVNSEAQ